MLLLFDIDGTLLLQASREHAVALREALQRVYGVRTERRVAAAGRTDTAIARELASLGGVTRERFDAGLEDLMTACAEAYARHCPAALADRLAPGVAELLATLDARSDVRCSLVTGNYEAVARLKLERAGIGRHFAAGQGAFGSDAEHRDALPPIARLRAGNHPRASTVVIGDTPLDIACARADGLRVLAVATGPYRADQLQDADAILSDCFELARALGCEPAA